MQIVIDMPNENYQVTLTKIMLACRGCSITELPKGHGDLIDRSDLMPDSDYEDGMFYAVSIGAINGAPTIIEADRSEEKE
jgi:hypothetical protein